MVLDGQVSENEQALLHLISSVQRPSRGERLYVARIYSRLHKVHSTYSDGAYKAKVTEVLLDRW